MSHTIYLGLGSNIGDRYGLLQQAILKLNESGITVKRTSSYWETEPVGYTDQPWFVNLVVEATSALPPFQLLKTLKQIEATLGRTLTMQNGPREIDIDVLLYNQEILESRALTIPHPRFHERKFVLEPLAELAPQLRHPILGKSISQLLSTAPQLQMRKVLSEKGPA